MGRVKPFDIFIMAFCLILFLAVAFFLSVLIAFGTQVSPDAAAAQDEQVVDRFELRSSQYVHELNNAYSLDVIYDRETGCEFVIYDDFRGGGIAPIDCEHTAQDGGEHD